MKKKHHSELDDLKKKREGEDSKGEMKESLPPEGQERDVRERQQEETDHPLRMRW
jgi:hypothetical protein